MKAAIIVSLMCVIVYFLWTMTWWDAVPTSHKSFLEKNIWQVNKTYLVRIDSQGYYQITWVDVPMDTCIMRIKQIFPHYFKIGQQ